MCQRQRGSRAADPEGLATQRKPSGKGWAACQTALHLANEDLRWAEIVA
jgi:hypothetical protein